MVTVPRIPNRYGIDSHRTAADDNNINRITNIYLILAAEIDFSMSFFIEFSKALPTLK